jgi:hypothetical protein
MASVDFDPEDYLDEVSTKDLISELSKRGARYNGKDGLFDLLGLNKLASLGDVLEKTTELYNRK